MSARPSLPDELLSAPKTAESVVPPPAPSAAPWPGPWLTVTRAGATILSDPSFEHEQRLGYARSGARIPVKSKSVSNRRCTAGWYEVVGGGFICANVGTTNASSPELKFVQRQPSTEQVLPYQYARNARNGTPLYHSVPTPEQMDRYEPYRASAKRSRVERAPAYAGVDEGGTQANTNGEVVSSGETTEAAARNELPWWQQPGAATKLSELTIEQLHAEADDVLAMRMVQGFYVAVDRAFRWNQRTWYKTTKGLVAPADRFWLVSGPTFKGVELDGQQWKLPVAWVYGWRKNSTGYSYDERSHALKPNRTFEAYTAIGLTGTRREILNTAYYETTDGLWLKAGHVRVAQPAEPPSDIGAHERWVDVNLTEQTLVAYEGNRPVYATLVSSGKKSANKEKDHSTPTGQWRIREKHLTTTMDGDGTAAGDLPYSIEDVPYVAYFYRSYALHGAFWHKNFGLRMSHGCVNLAPLDAKRIFFFVDPPLPEGWHGVWANPKQPGSRVIVHE